jgi:hypothetical protein
VDYPIRNSTHYLLAKLTVRYSRKSVFDESSRLTLPQSNKLARCCSSSDVLRPPARQANSIMTSSLLKRAYAAAPCAFGRYFFDMNDSKEVRKEISLELSDERYAKLKQPVPSNAIRRTRVSDFSLEDLYCTIEAFGHRSVKDLKLTQPQASIRRSGTFRKTRL